MEITVVDTTSGKVFQFVNSEALTTVVQTSNILKAPRSCRFEKFQVNLPNGRKSHSGEIRSTGGNNEVIAEFVINRRSRSGHVHSAANFLSNYGVLIASDFKAGTKIIIGPSSDQNVCSNFAEYYWIMMTNTLGLEWDLYS